ncbi:hypothetical protein NG895_10850 [Aeoliella sp. ICT_H6.2]|uniref:Uncharacterized protein n=1 Tax=Aeoliella straminimaris TaxID=2954799 RepID=A0A9X2FDM8_9BACT|nr:hypothetical protein [Aeoliella straminimaris]MCO6044404.1 hypothetical protein [Aeoliella straminimaris]
MRQVTLTDEQLEWIVSEVVRRLRASGAVPAPTASTAGTLTLPERLVTLETLKGKLGGVGRVEVGCRAIVTPAVVDELKEKKIELVRG